MVTEALATRCNNPIKLILRPTLDKIITQFEHRRPTLSQLTAPRHAATPEPPRLPVTHSNFSMNS
jgi:hypothetical protein